MTDLLGVRAEERRRGVLGEVGNDGNLITILERFQLPAEEGADDATRINARQDRVLKSFAMHLAGPCILHSIFLRKKYDFGLLMYALPPGVDTPPRQERAVAGESAAERTARIRRNAEGGANFITDASGSNVLRLGLISTEGVIVYPGNGLWNNYFPVGRNIVFDIDSNVTSGEIDAMTIEIGLNIISNLS